MSITEIISNDIEIINHDADDMSGNSSQVKIHSKRLSELAVLLHDGIEKFIVQT